MRTWKWIEVALVYALACCLARAMSGDAHLMDAELLLDSPAGKGGAKGLPVEKLESIQRWIDNPSQKTGEYINHATGESVHPGNHGHLRHNPENVARAWSGDGSVDPAVRNVARLHKIQDVSHNTAGLDGYEEITDKMRKEAEEVLEYVRTKNRLPRKLPHWVDNSGPLITGRVLKAGGRQLSKAGRTAEENADEAAKALTRSSSATRYAPESAGETGAASGAVRAAGKIVRKAGKVAGVVGVAVEVGIRGKDVYDTEKAYEQGEISSEERGSRHSANAGGLLGGTTGASGGAWGGAAIGAACGGPVGAVIGGIAGGIVGGFGGDFVGTTIGKTVYDWIF